jgi:hypothetical protein
MKNLHSQTQSQKITDAFDATMKPIAINPHGPARGVQGLRDAHMDLKLALTCSFGA